MLRNIFPDKDEEFEKDLLEKIVIKIECATLIFFTGSKLGCRNAKYENIYDQAEKL